MPATKRGIYHNLRESKYVVTNGEIFFFFSSEFYMEKFLQGYKKNREECYKRYKWYYDELNINTLADVLFYVQSEKRGFHAQLKGGLLSWQEIQKYVLRKMTEKNTSDWYETHRPKLGERHKSLV